MGTTLKQLAYVIWNLWLFRMKCDPYVNLLSRESHKRFTFITVKQIQVYFRPLQKLSRKWIQSTLPRHVTFTWKPWKICFYQSDFKFIFARFRNRAASEYNQFRRLASVLRTSSLKLLSCKTIKRFAFIKAISSSFSLASETEPQVNTINFATRVNVANKRAKVAFTTCIPLSLRCGPFVRLFSRGIGQATSLLLCRFFQVSMLDSKDSKPNSIIDAQSSRIYSFVLCKLTVFMFEATELQQRFILSLT